MSRRGVEAAGEPGAVRHELSPYERRSVTRAARLSGGDTSGRSAARAKRLREQAPDLAAQVQAGELTLYRAERILLGRLEGFEDGLPVRDVRVCERCRAEIGPARRTGRRTRG